MGLKAKDVPQYGEIWIVDFMKENSSHLYTGKRPALVIQSYSVGTETIYVAPISTSYRKPAPYIQPIVLREVSYIHYEQIVPVVTKRFRSKLRDLTEEELKGMKTRLRYEFGLSWTHKELQELSKEGKSRIKPIEVREIILDEEKEDYYIAGRANIGSETFEYCAYDKNLSVSLESYTTSNHLTELEDYFNTLQGMKELMSSWSV